MRINHIKIKWADEINPNDLEKKYPRPQMVRENWQSLNGLYNYAVTCDFDKKPDAWDGEILVPFSIETDLSGVGRILQPDEYLHYQRVFKAKKKKNEKVLLNFEAVDWHSKVYINDVFAGEHIGGYIPFCIDITDNIKDGENTLHVAVYDPTDSQQIQRGKQTLSPKKIWHTATSGIWQSVWIEYAPEEHILDVLITPNPDSSEVVFVVHSDFEGQAEITILDTGNQIAISKGETNSEIHIPMDSPILWSPDNPYLYDAGVRLLSKGEADNVKCYFGMRKIEIKKDSKGIMRTFLNNEPIFLNGVLDQGYWPESGMTPPCDEAIEFDIKQIKELGFNMIRKHVKIESRRWYHHADKIGMIVFQDMVSGGKSLVGKSKTPLLMMENAVRNDTTKSAYKKAGRASSMNRMYFEREILDMIYTLYSVPSILAWTTFSEGWGQYNSEIIAGGIKRKDPNRLLDATSGGVDRGAGDFNSIHRYVTKLPNPKKDDRAYFISEYGGCNLQIKDNMLPAGDKFGHRFFRNKKDLSDAYEKLISMQLLPLIKKGLTASVYTQLTDVETESNGIFTYDRKVLKFDKEQMKAANQAIYKAFKESM